ncbi:MAG: SH3 domain-containing protein [Clostridia bacterium]|nr:SH3 domain-containing protein [Clostridia bacterium]
MKRTLSFLMALALMLCVVGEIRQASANVLNMYVATYDYYGLKLRPEPSTNRTEYCKIPHGTLLTIYEFTLDGLWCRTQYGGYEGWVMYKYLTEYKPRALTPQDPGPSKPTPAPQVVTPVPTEDPSRSGTINEMNAEFEAMMKNMQPENMTVMCVRRGTKCYLRWAPSTSAKAIRNDVVYGDTFTVLAIGNKWYQIYDTTTGRVGYILISLTALAGTMNNTVGN